MSTALLSVMAIIIIECLIMAYLIHFKKIKEEYYGDDYFVCCGVVYHYTI